MTIKELCKAKGVISYKNFMSIRAKYGMTGSAEDVVNKQIDDYIANSQIGMHDGSFAQTLKRYEVEPERFYGWVNYWYGSVEDVNMSMLKEYIKVLKACRTNGFDMRDFSKTFGKVTKYERELSMQEKIEIYKDIIEARRLIDEAGCARSAFYYCVRLNYGKNSISMSQADIAKEYLNNGYNNSHSAVCETQKQADSFYNWKKKHKEKLAGLSKGEINKIFLSTELKIKYGIGVRTDERKIALEYIIEEIKKKDIAKCTETLPVICDRLKIKKSRFGYFRQIYKNELQGLNKIQLAEVYIMYTKVI